MTPYNKKQFPGRIIFNEAQGRTIFYETDEPLYIRVQYTDGSFDYVSDRMLNKLLATRAIKQFYRYSEQRWIIVGVDRLRAMGQPYRIGDRRRDHGGHVVVMGKKRGDPLFCIA